MLWVTKEQENKVHLLSFLVTARIVRDGAHVEKCSNGFLYLKEMVKTFDWDKFNPAYMSEVRNYW
jgi:hypothetical protein